MKSFPLIAWGVVMVLAGDVAAQEKNGEDAKLAAFFKKYLDEEIKLRPLDATRLGDHRYDHLLDDLSAKARASTTERTKKTLETLPKEINYKKLSRDGQIDFEILQHHLKKSLWLDENTDSFATDPRVYSEYVSDSVFLLLAQSTVPKETAIKSCIARINEIPRLLKDARDNLKSPPKTQTETAIRQNSGSIRFYESGLFDIVGTTPQKEELRKAADKAVAALKDYHKWLESDLLPRAKGDWRIGKEKFYKKLELELDAGLTADEVLREATAEMARVQRDMYVVARQLWAKAYPGKPLLPDDAEGRRRTIQLVLDHFNKEHSKAEELVRDAQNGVKAIKEFIAKNDILRLPDPDRCAILEMPEFQRGNSVAYLNPAPPLDPRARSIYAVSPPPRDWDDRRKQSYFEEYNRHMLLILSIHEGYPGHYVQLEYANRYPSLVRKVLYSGVFAEGWAVYTEQMMLDQGFGDGSLTLRLNQLKFYLRAVANAVLDHKMHCEKMTDAEAMKFLTEEAFQSEGEAVGKVIRSKQSSVQLSTYFVGRTAFYRLRQQIQRQMGDRFQLGRYHEAALSHGTLPVKYLPALVTRSLQGEK